MLWCVLSVSDILFHGSDWWLVPQVVQQSLVFGGDIAESLKVYHSLGQVRVRVCKPAKNVTRLGNRLEKTKFGMGWGLHRPHISLRGARRYNNLQLFVLMLFQNVVLQSLGKRSDVIMLHTHTGEYSVIPRPFHHCSHYRKLSDSSGKRGQRVETDTHSQW